MDVYISKSEFLSLLEGFKKIWFKIFAPECYMMSSTVSGLMVILSGTYVLNSFIDFRM